DGRSGARQSNGALVLARGPRLHRPSRIGPGHRLGGQIVSPRANWGRRGLLLGEVAAVQPAAVAAARFVVERLVAVARLLARPGCARALEGFAALGFDQELGGLGQRRRRAGGASPALFTD